MLKYTRRTKKTRPLGHPKVKCNLRTLLSNDPKNILCNYKTIAVNGENLSNLYWENTSPIHSF